MAAAMRLLRATLVLCCALSGCRPSAATRSWECIAPAAAGGGWDMTCRAAGRVMEELGLAPGAVRTVNMPGAGGGVAYAHAATRREGDPSVLVAASSGTTLRLAQGQYGHLTPDDVRWVGAVGAEYGIVAVAADAPWADLPALVEAWRRDPGSVVSAGGSAVAGQDHMKVLLLARAAGADPRRIRYVPFDGGGEALTALLGGFVQVFTGDVSEVEGLLAAGSLRVLAVLSAERLDGPMAAVPTAREQGLDVTWTTWRGFFVPSGLEPDRYEAWVAALDSLGRSEAWAEARRAARLRPFHRVGPEFEAFVRDEVAGFRALSREIGLIR